VGAFKPLPRDNRAFGKERRDAKDRTRRARRKLPAHPAIPRVPVLPSYTERQRQVIRDTYRRAADQAGVRSYRELYAMGNYNQRRNMRRVGARMADSDPAINYARIRNQSDTVAPDPRTQGERTRGRTIAAIQGATRFPGTNTDLTDVGKAIAAPPAVVWNLGRATVEDPGGVAKSTVRSAVESITGIPQAVKMIVDDPGGALKMIAEDYERRYGTILSDPALFRQRVQEEYGLTPYVLDAAALGGGTGQALGATARSGAAGRAVAALERTRTPGARVARELHDATRQERPALRFSGGTIAPAARATRRKCSARACAPAAPESGSSDRTTRTPPGD
jgi:hypothetical protein